MDQILKGVKLYRKNPKRERQEKREKWTKSEKEIGQRSIKAGQKKDLGFYMLRPAN